MERVCQWLVSWRWLASVAAAVCSLAVWASPGSAYVRATQTAAVDTGYKANPKSQFYCDFQWTENQRKQWLFGNNDNGGTFTAAVYINGSEPHLSAWALQDGVGNWKATGVWASLERSTAVLDGPGNRYQIKMYSPQGEVVTQNDTISTTRSKTATSSTALFACHNKDGSWDTACWGTPLIYSFEVRESGVLKHFFAPYQEGSAIGFKDIVTGAVKTNAGTGGELVYSDGVGRASDYKYENGRLSCKVYAAANSSDWGTVLVNGAAAPADGTWVLQSGTITLKAIPAAGYTFLGWAGDAESIQNAGWRNAEVTVSPSAAKRLVAAFVPRADCVIKDTLVTLVRDADWRGASLAVPYGMSMNLNGHKLQVSDTEGPGEVVNYAVDGLVRAAAVPVPAIVSSSASFWLDAANTDSITLNETRNVTAWRSRVGSVTANGDSLKPRYEPYSFGRPTVDFGDFSNKRDMTYTRFTKLRTVFWVMQIADNANNFLLGDGTAYNFHRGSSAQATIGNETHAKFSKVWLGGQSVNWKTTKLPAEGFNVIAATMSVDACSDRLTTDRTCFDKTAATGRSGGRQLSELICFNTTLSDADIAAVNEYLRAKWACFNSPGAAELHLDVPAECAVDNGTLRIMGNVRVVKDGAGTLTCSKVRQLYTAGTEVAAGTLKLGGPGAHNFSAVGRRRPLGTYESEIRVKQGATFDFNGRAYCEGYMFQLDGGTLANYGRDVPLDYCTMARVYLNADSTFAGNTFGLIQSGYGNAGLYLQNHTFTLDLSAPDKQFVIANAYIGPGKIHLVQGRLRNYKASNYARETDIIGEANSSISSDASGFFYPRTITTKGRVLGGNWIYANSYVHDNDTEQENTGALNATGVSSSSVTFTKRGSGLLKVGNSNNNYTGPVTIEEGGVKLTSHKALGSGAVTIKNGAWIDLDLQCNGNSGNQSSSVSIIGHGDGNGAIQNNAFDMKALIYHTPLNNMTLAGNASIGGSAPVFAVIASSYAAFTWNLGAYTLEKRGNCVLMPCYATVNGTGTFDIASGALAAMGSVTVNSPIVFRSGSKLDLNIRDASKGAKVILNGDATFEDPAPTDGEYGTVELNGVVRGLATFGHGTLVLGGASRIELPAGAAKFTAGGATLVKDGATLDVAALFANGEPAGEVVTVFESAEGITGFLNVTGMSEGWKVQYGAGTVSLVKGTPTQVMPLLTVAQSNVYVNASTTITVPPTIAATLTPGVYTLARWNTAASGYGTPVVDVTGCPYETELICEAYDVKLVVKSAEVVARKETRIWCVGDQWVDTANRYRVRLAQKLTLLGYNVKMTGFRTTNATDPAGATTKEAWRGHTGFASACFKSNASYAGLIEGIETYAMAAEDPSVTVLTAGVFEYWGTTTTGETAAANWEELVRRILAACPNTKVVAVTCPVQTYNQTADDTKTRRDTARATMNAAIRAACAKSAAEGGFPEGRVILVDLANDAELVPAKHYADNWQLNVAGWDWLAEKFTAAIAAAVEPAGRDATTYAPRASGALANVPSEYTTGYTKLAAIALNGKMAHAQNQALVPYSYLSDNLPSAGLTKVGYYIELVRADSGETKSMWIDMDAPGGAFSAVTLPVTCAQKRQQSVTKLHVWSDFAGVRQVAANDDSVTGAIFFNPVNYSVGAKNYTGAVAELWKDSYDWNDTMSDDATSGHGGWMFYRVLPSGSVPAAETLFYYSAWGASATSYNAIGFGSVADKKTFTGNNTINGTFLSSGAGDDRCKINGAAYSKITVEIWGRLSATPARDDTVDGTWTGDASTDFAATGNWKKNGTAIANLTGAKLLVPSSVANAEFSYVGKDPVTINPYLIVDGGCTFGAQGAIQLARLDVNGRFTLDPAKVSIRVATAPRFATGAKLALTANYAVATKGRFLVFSWDRGEFTGDLASIFDTASASGGHPELRVETLPSGAGRLWLDLDSTATYPTLRVMPVGDSITHGSISSYGNWRIPLMKKLLAAGFNPVSTGMHADQSADETGCEIPESWKWHSGVSGRKLMTVQDKSAGVIDAIETELDQAGDVDVLLLKIGTNDINSNGTDADTLFAAWCELRDKILVQSQCKLICGAVVNIADATKNAQVTAFNAKVKAACEADTTGRLFYADLYGVCPRTDGDGNFIDGSFYSSTDLHPDWPGEDKMAEEYCRVIQLALANGMPVHPAPTATSTALADNVPSNYLDGFRLARSFDAKYTGGMASGVVPYDDFSANLGATSNLARVGYYIALKRKNTAITDYHGMVRWLWVDITAFGDRDLETCGIPRNRTSQCRVAALHIASNMPGIEQVLPTDDSVNGYVEFWPWNYKGDASGVAGAPAHLENTDWNDTCNFDNNYSCMQVHRLLPSGSRNPAQVLFAFNHWNPADSENQVGLGTFAFHQKSSLDWTWVTGAEHASAAVFDSSAYEIARIEIWTRSVAEEAELTGVGALKWAPQDGEAAVAADVAAWRNATDTTDATIYPFRPGASLVFDASASSTAVLVTPGAVSAGEVTFSGAKNYTLGGGASLRATRVNVGLATSASLTIDGGRLDADELLINSGKVVLGANRLVSSLGANADGVIRIGPNGQLDINNTSTANNNNIYNSTLADKIVYIEGDGPDGRGAIINFGGANYWHQLLTRVVLVGDASIGGNARTDFRLNFTSRKYTGRCQLQGEGFVLTDRFVKSSDYGLHFNNTDINLRKLVLVENAVMGFEGTINLTIPEGIELNSGSRIDLYQTTINGVGEIRVKSGVTAILKCNSSNAIFNVPVIVEEGATLQLVGGNAIRFDRGIENHGKIENAGGSTWINPDDDWTGVTLDTSNFAFTSGNLWLGDYTTSSQANLAKLEVVGPSTGEIWLRTGTGTEIDGTKWKINAPNAELWAASELNGAVNIGEVAPITVRDADWTVGKLHMGSASYNGHLVLDNSKITASTFSTDLSTNYKSGYLALNNGSQVTITSANHGIESVAAQLASTTSSWGFESILEINSGSEFAVPNGYTFIGWSGRYGHLDINAGGTATLYGVVGRRRYNGIGGGNKRGHDAYLLLNGGTLNIGPAAFMHGFMAYSSKAISTEACNDHYPETGPVIRLNDGVVNVTANTVDNNSQRSPGVNVAFGDRPENAGEVVFDVKNYTFDLRTGVKGSSDVTLRGNGGTFKSSQWSQGIATGRWTVESGVNALLDGAVGFQGGLELASGATAQVNAKSESLVLSYSGSVLLSSFMTGADYCNFYATDLHYIHQKKHSVGPNYHTYGYRGEFYVPAEKVGTWYFYGSWDDGINLTIDGKSLTSGADVKGSIALTEGWHSFICGATDGYGGQGPDWGNTDMGIGYRIGSDGGTTYANYTRFDTDTLKMRPPRDVQFSHKKYAASWVVYDFEDFVTRRPEDYDSAVVTNSVKQWNNTTATDNLFTTNKLQLARNRVVGRLYVAPAQAGVWQAKLGYDDFSAFFIDGKLVAGAPSHTYQSRGSIVLTAGVHEFEFYFGDTAGGYGLNSQAAIYPYSTLAVSVNGGSYVPFDEDHFQLGADPFLGLAGDSRLGKGSVLTNIGAAAYPVTGTLWGAGKLAGAFAFKGGWLGIEGEAANYSVPKLENGVEDAFAELAGVRASFTGRPGRRLYVLGDANGLDGNSVRQLGLDIAINGIAADEAEKMAGEMYLRVLDGRLELINPGASPMAIYFR